MTMMTSEQFIKGYKLGSEAAIDFLKDELDLHEDHQEEIIEACREHVERVIADIKKVTQ